MAHIVHIRLSFLVAFSLERKVLLGINVMSVASLMMSYEIQCMQL